MAKTRKKKRTHVSEEAPGKPGTGNRRPRSMVIRMGAGDVGPAITQLAKDFRGVMEPDTASRLKERKNNKLKDYTAMAGPLGVSHLFLFSRSSSGNVHLRVGLHPRGPTLTFRLERYALCKDIAKAQKHPRGGGLEYLHAPLLVMNNFSTQSADGDVDPIKKQLESLTTTIFQSMFPPISPQSTPLSSIRRILLLNRESQSEGAYIISLRHYAITTRKTGVSKRVRRFDDSERRHREKKSGVLPNLGKLDDVADYILDPTAGGYTSASETELDTDAEVEVLETTTQKVLSKKEQQRRAKEEQNQENGSNVEKRAVKLVELGPRMRLRLVKVEEGICEGRVMWNEFVKKTKAEEKELDAKWEVRRTEKEERKRVQRENVEKKKALKQKTKTNTQTNAAGEAGGDFSEEEMDTDEAELEAEGWEDDDDDDDGGQNGVRVEDNEEDHDEEMDG